MTETELTLWQAYQLDRSIINRNRLIENYIPLVWRQSYRLAAKYRQYTASEFFSSGIIGLIDSIETYWINGEVHFIPVAARRITGAMLDDLRKNHQWSTGERSGRTTRPMMVSLTDDVECDSSKKSEYERELILQTVLKGLSSRQRAVLSGYYLDPKPLSKIGQSLDLSETRVSHIHRDTLTQIRERLAGRE